MPGSSSTFNRPPLDGSLNLLQIVQYNGKHSPQHPLFRYYEETCNHDIVWSEAVVAFRRAAQYFLQQAPHAPSESKKPVVAILAAVDSITYFSTIVGIMLAGFVPFPISSRNSPGAVEELLAVIGCNWVVASTDPATTALLANLPRKDENSAVKVLPMPKFADLFSTSQDAVDSGHFPGLDIDDDSPCIILHSSGTTSTPKPIRLTHKMVFEHGLQPCFGEVDLCGHMFSAQAIPMYHLMGFISIPWTTMLGLSVAVFSPTTKAVIPSPEVVLSNAVATHCSILYCVPTFLEDWARNATNVRTLKSFTAVFYAGGPLTTLVGNLLFREGINIAPMFGLTEIGAASHVVPARPPPEGWEWLRIAPKLDVVFVPVEPKNEGVFKLVVKANEFKTPAVINTAIDGVPAYDTNDLVVRHAQNEGLWKFYGRHDDRITHSTGEKTNPVPIETLLAEDQNISTVLVFGDQRFQLGALVLPSPKHTVSLDNPKSLADYRNLIWDTVAKVNKNLPQHSRIFKELIIVSRAEKPFEFTSKGTPRRQAVLRKYEPEIENAYKAYEETVLSDVPTLASSDHKDTLYSVRTIVHIILERTIDDNQDIFLAGGDRNVPAFEMCGNYLTTSVFSLCAISIRNTIINHLRGSGRVSTACIRGIPYDFVYTFPTISSLAAFVFGLTLASEHKSDGEMDDMIDDSAGIQKPIPPNDSFVEIQTGKLPALIFLPGLAGRATPFARMPSLSTAVWAAQLTNDTPNQSLEELADFFIAKIKEKQPTGPYRLAGYSASTLLLICMVKKLEKSGQEVVQYVMVDHFPTLYLQGIDPENSPLASEISWKEYIKQSVMLVADGISNTETKDTQLASDRKRLADNIRGILKGQYGNDEAKRFVANSGILLRMSLEFLLGKQFWTVDAAAQTSVWSEKLLHDWMRDVHVPLTVYVTPNGMAKVINLSSERAFDLGAKVVYPDVRVVSLEGDHYSCLWYEDFTEDISKGFGN
ncbi:hypothetical protein M422DRAFT_269298 [Sphaerobolus stellatus SS14]|uniref:Unplaced genomic scaffold SPHSTscaffold_210, whole genome shotgun sequence n=1 Tax=Sphaerobolus stellatus (strain SS14) TaxID=990650 RepID=A0A0C9UKF1_SPHS4|nr:hypothetical protein M422DRAFT_269298 [Sphaerobolus stellatus SS14]